MYGLPPDLHERLSILYIGRSSPRKFLKKRGGVLRVGQYYFSVPYTLSLLKLNIINNKISLKYYVTEYPVK